MECVGLDDPVAAMHKLVDDLLQESGQREAPINLSVVASFRGIIEIRTESINSSAILVLTPLGLRVSVNLADPIGRRNFSVAHEVCHTLFPNYAKHPVPKVDKFIGRFSIPQEEEYLCDLGASRLLMPPALVLPKVLSYGPYLNAIIQLAEDFQSSLEAAAIAWAQASPWPCAVVFFEECLKPRQEKRKDQLILPGMENNFRLEPELRIALACASTTFPWFLPKYKSISRGGVIYAARFAQRRTQGKDVIKLEGKCKEVNAESLYVPYRREENLRDRVMSFISPVNGTMFQNLRSDNKGVAGSDFINNTTLFDNFPK
jgi:hypothetical protein